MVKLMKMRIADQEKQAINQTIQSRAPAITSQASMPT